jgi:Holliday junction resolvasome RuvABC endonuclease subunit
MKVLSIDHGKRSGYAVMDKGEVIIVGWFELNEKDNNKKLFEFHCKVNQLILEHKPDIIACEYPSDMVNAETSRQLIGYYTIIKLHAVSFGIPIEECHVGTVRKMVTGTGKAEKVTVCDSLVAKLNIPRGLIEKTIYYSDRGRMAGKIKGYSYDESDALALAYYTTYKEGKWTVHGTMPYELEG